MEHHAAARVAARGDDDDVLRSRACDGIGQGRARRVVAREVEREIDDLGAGGNRVTDAFRQPELGSPVARIEHLDGEDGGAGRRAHVRDARRGEASLADDDARHGRAVAVVVVGMRVVVHEIKAGGELRRVEDRCPGVRARRIQVVLVRDAAVEHRHDRAGGAAAPHGGVGGARAQQAVIARLPAGGEVPGLRIRRAADQNAVRLGGRDAGSGAKRVQRTLERHAGGELHQVEHRLPGGDDGCSDESQGVRARPGVAGSPARAGAH